MVGGVELPGLCWLVAFLLCPSEIQLATEAYPKPISPPIENHAAGLQIMISNWGFALSLPAGRCDCQSVVKMGKEIQTDIFHRRPNSWAVPTRACFLLQCRGYGWPISYERPTRMAAAPSASSQAHCFLEVNCSGFTVFGQVFFVGAMSKPVDIVTVISREIFLLSSGVARLIHQ